jgi:hypothetical protein
LVTREAPKKLVNYGTSWAFTAVNRDSDVCNPGPGDALMAYRSSNKNWVPEPLSPPWWDNAFAIVVAVTIVTVAGFGFF